MLFTINIASKQLLNIVRFCSINLRFKCRSVFGILIDVNIGWFSSIKSFQCWSIFCSINTLKYRFWLGFGLLIDINIGMFWSINGFKHCSVLFRKEI